MRRTTTIISIGLVAILAATVLLSISLNTWFGRVTDQQRKEGITGSWQTFQNDEFDFTFRYPPRAIVDVAVPAAAGEPKKVRVRLIGPESAPNTEITDGFTFYVRSMTISEQEMFARTAQRIYENTTEQNEVINELQEDSGTEGQNIYRFSIRTKLGDEHQFIIFKGGGDVVFITSSTVSVPDHTERNYTDMIEKMKQSLKPVSHNP